MAMPPTEGAVASAVREPVAGRRPVDPGAPDAPRVVRPLLWCRSPKASSGLSGPRCLPGMGRPTAAV